MTLSTQRLRFEQVQGVFAIMPTPATPDGGQVQAEFTVDLEEAARGGGALVQDGVNAIMINGTFGEAATLTEEEWRQFTRTVVEAVNGRIPVIAGPTTLNTRTTIERARFARDVGASGLLLGRPFWCELPPEAVIQFYRDVAEAVPEMGIIVYNNPAAFKSKLPPKLWAELAKIPQIVGAKYGSNPAYAESLEAVRGRIRLMTIEKDWYKVYSQFPDESIACWSGGASCDPYPAIALREAVFAGDNEAAQRLTEEIAATYETFFPNGDRELFRLYTIQVEKLRIEGAGYIKAGPCRPPYHEIPQAFAEGALESGRRWRDLARRLRVAATV